MSEEEKIIEDIKEIINKCKECKFATCEQCEINWTQIKTIEHLLDLYQTEKIGNENLQMLLDEEKEKNKQLENADLTTVYINGFYDGEKKWKDKIKEKIKYIEENYSEHSGFPIGKSIEFLQELLEERN